MLLVMYTGLVSIVRTFRNHDFRICLVFRRVLYKSIIIIVV